MKTAILVVLSALCVTGCVDLHASASLSGCEVDDAKLIALAIEHEVEIDDRLPGKFAVVYPEPASARSLARHLSNVKPETLINELVQRGEDNSDNSGVATSELVRFVGHEERAQVFLGSGKSSVELWRAFRVAFPGAKYFVHASRPAYSPEFDRAVVYLEKGVGPEIVEGALVRFSCDGTRWKVAESRTIWSS